MPLRVFSVNMHLTSGYIVEQCSSFRLLNPDWSILLKISGEPAVCKDGVLWKSGKNNVFEMLHIFRFYRRIFVFEKRRVASGLRGRL